MSRKFSIKHFHPKCCGSGTIRVPVAFETNSNFFKCLKIQLFKTYIRDSERIFCSSNHESLMLFCSWTQGCGFVSFWASQIRIRIHYSQLRIRILPSSSKNRKKNLDFYCFVTSLWLLIFEEWCKCTSVPDLDLHVFGPLRFASVSQISILIRIHVLRIHDILVWIRIRGSMPLTNGSGSCYFRH